MRRHSRVGTLMAGILVCAGALAWQPFGSTAGAAVGAVSSPQNLAAQTPTSPQQTLYTPGGPQNYLYVGSPPSSSPVYPSTKIPIPGNEFLEPSAVAVTPNGEIALVATSTGVAAISTVTNTVTNANIAVGPFPTPSPSLPMEPRPT